MITFFKILEIYGIDPANIKLVRHGNKEIPVLRTFREDIDRLEVYQSYQHPRKYGSASSIAVFAPYHKTTSLFLGLWDIVACTPTDDLPEEARKELEVHSLPLKWLSNHVRYELKRNPKLDELSERLVIEWGGAPVSWVQTKDKKIVELKAAGSIGDFRSFEEVNLPLHDIQTISAAPDSNYTWITALSSVNGIYLIRHRPSGKLYVGSAYGEQGIWGRWATYAKTGHGGNMELRDLEPTEFQFSILEILPPTITADGAIAAENRWKEKLGTREVGLNRN